MAGLREAAIPVRWSPLGWGENAWGAEYGPLIDPGPTDSSQNDIVELPIAHDTVVVHSTPVWNEWLEGEARWRRVVAFTTWESDRLPDGHVDALNRFDLVVVPSRFNVETFMASGVTVPVAAVPHIARPVTVAPPPPPTGRLRFYTIGTWTTRKALADTVTAFTGAFDRHDDVSLLVCTTEEDHIALTRLARRGWAVDSSEGQSWFTLDRLVAGLDDHGPIELRTEPMTPAEVEEVHRSSHCFVSLSRGEGWGLGAFDAAAHGNPVVVTGWGGALDFLPEDYPYLIDYDLVPSGDDEPDGWLPPSRGRWAKARTAHASALLRSVHEERQAAWSCASGVAMDLRTRFDSATATARLLEVLGRVPVRGSDPA
jgi:glycosyltransferase involved in cell wall biosynthesis